MVLVEFLVVYIDFGIYKIFANFVGLLCAFIRDRPMSHANMKSIG